MKNNELVGNVSFLWPFYRTMANPKRNNYVFRNTMEFGYSKLEKCLKIGSLYSRFTIKRKIKNVLVLWEKNSVLEVVFTITGSSL